MYRQHKKHSVTSKLHSAVEVKELGKKRLECLEMVKINLTIYKYAFRANMKEYADELLASAKIWGKRSEDIKNKLNDMK
jgi:hypothetical protein